MDVGGITGGMNEGVVAMSKIDSSMKKWKDAVKRYGKHRNCMIFREYSDAYGFRDSLTLCDPLGLMICFQLFRSSAKSGKMMLTSRAVYNGGCISIKEADKILREHKAMRRSLKRGR